MKDSLVTFYRVKDLDGFSFLMEFLEAQNCKWVSGHKPTSDIAKKAFLLVDQFESLYFTVGAPPHGNKEIGFILLKAHRTKEFKEMLASVGIEIIFIDF